MKKEILKNNFKRKNGITLIALVVTIIVLIILAGISVNMVVNDKGIIKRAEDVKLRADYQNVNITLDSYKLKKSLATVDGEETTDESLLGTIYKKVFVEDTKRELAVLVDFNEIGVKPTYGQGGKKLVKDDNNDMSTTKTVSTVYELGNIYAIDLADGSLYYINGEQIYTEEGSIVEVAENETTVNKYEVETLNQAYIEARKFKTKWNVTLGEEVGSETYSTVVLPASFYAYNSAYDAIIEWGDGTSTVVQHRVNGITLSNEELTEKVTHHYTLQENDDGIREISISGRYSSFTMSQYFSGTTPTKLKLIGIEQWGNISVENINFNGSTNLAGNIPSPNIEGCFANCTRFDRCFSGCIGLTGNIPVELFDSATNCTTFLNCFNGCTGLTGNIPKGLFDSCTEATTFERCFYGCTGLTGNIPDKLFANKIKCTRFTRCFENCTGLTGEIPEDLFLNCPNVTRMDLVFDTTGIDRIPNNLLTNVNNGENNKITDISGLFEGTKISEVPANLFEKCPDVTIIGTNWSYGGLFQDCKNLTTIPEGLFKNCTKITGNMGNVFRGCTNLTSLPEDFTIPEGVTDLYYTFNGCNSLINLPDNFTIPNSVTNMRDTFCNCSSLTNLPANFTIPNGVTNMTNTFNGCRKLKGTMTIKANPTDYRWVFGSVATESGGTLTVNYTSNCTNIDDIIATGNSAYVKKGSLVE